MISFKIFALFTSTVLGLSNFEFEDVQLIDSETAGYPAIRFGDRAKPLPQEPCRYTPDDDEWPSDSDWKLFNETLGGALLKPRPLSASCYAGSSYDAAKCANLINTWRGMTQQ